MGTQKTTVLISYSWDNEKHEEWVLELSNRLYDDGVTVLLDKFDLKPGDDLLHFMENSVRQADKVLLILTPNYKIKAENRKGGVGYEVSMMAAEIFNQQDTDKFIPIFRGERIACTPNFLSSRLGLDMSDNGKFEEKYAELKDVILDTHSMGPHESSAMKITSDSEIDDLSVYLNYTGGPIPSIELKKYSLSKMAALAQKKHDYLKVVELKLENAKICREQGGKESDIYLLEEGIRKAYLVLSSKDKGKVKRMIRAYNEDMAKYIDQDIQRYLK